MITNLSHTKFKKNLQNSIGPVNFVANWLRQLGYIVEVPETKVAETPEKRFQNIDKGDIYATKEGIKKRVEVKQVKENFTGIRDWAFKNQFIVCAKHSFDNAIPKPYCYVVLSHDYKAMAFVLGENSHNWFSKDIKDKRYGENYSQVFYLCKPEEVIWYILEDNE